MNAAILVTMIVALNFAASKKTMTKHFYRGKTFYCGCKYIGKKIDWKSCGFKPYKDAKRASRLEWEHVVPAAHFGRKFKAWTEGHPRCMVLSGKKYKGRRCASKVSKKFRTMEGDMHNLRPAVGEVNGNRSNYPFRLIEGEERRYGSCDFEIKDRTAEPAEHIRGDIARTYLYMHTVYPGLKIINAKNRMLYMRWDYRDPVDDAECSRYRKIKRISRTENPVLKEKCEKHEKN